MIFFKNLYNWTLDQSSKKYASWFLAFISFIESSFFPIPPDIILIPMIIANRAKAFLFAFICTVSSVLGGLLGYLIGFAMFNSIGILLVNFYGLQEYINNLREYYNNYGIWFVLIASLRDWNIKL